MWMRVYILLHGSMCTGICVNVYTHACLLLRTNTHDSSPTFSVTGIILFSHYRWWVMCSFIFGVYCDMLTLFSKFETTNQNWPYMVYVTSSTPFKGRFYTSCHQLKLKALSLSLCDVCECGVYVFMYGCECESTLYTNSGLSYIQSDRRSNGQRFISL